MLRLFASCLTTGSVFRQMRRSQRRCCGAALSLEGDAGVADRPSPPPVALGKWQILKPGQTQFSPPKRSQSLSRLEYLPLPERNGGRAGSICDAGVTFK